MMRIKRSITSFMLAGLLAVQSILPTYAAADEIHLINDLGSGGKGTELTLEEEADRNWGEDLVSVAKGAWYDTHNGDEENAGVKKATPASLATASDLASTFEDFDEVKAQKDVEKLLKKADKETVSQSGTWISHMLKEAVIPKEAVPRESSLKSETLALHQLNDDDYTVFRTEGIPQTGDIVFFAKTAEKKATGSNIAATSSDLHEDTSSEDLSLKRKAAKAALGGIIIEVETDHITFLYSAEKDKIEIGYMPMKNNETIGFASMHTLHNKYCGLLEELEEKLEEEEPVVEEDVVPLEEIREYPTFTHEETIWGYRISLSADEGVFPDGTTVSIKPVTTIDGQNIEELLQKQSDKETITKVMSFDITFTCDGEEIQPEDGSVSVSIHLASDMLQEKRKSDKNEVVVYHIPDAETVDKVASHLNAKNEVEYEAEKFSVYSVAVKMSSVSGQYEYVVKNGKATITKFNWDYLDYYHQQYSNSTDIPRTIDGYEVEAIGDNAFYNLDKMQYVCFPDTVISIGDSAFACCDMLDEYEIETELPPQLEVIGDHAFSFSGHLRIKGLPSSLKYLGNGAFAYCTELTNIWIPKALGNTDLYEGPFSYCVNLHTLTFEPGIKRIPANFCNLMTGLTTIKIPDSVQEIGEGAFAYSALETIDIPSSVVRIGDGAFYGTELDRVVLPTSLKSIGNEAFKFNPIKSLKIPNSVTSIGDSAFDGCSKLREVVLPENITQINDWLFNLCSSLESVHIPNKVKSIGSRAFSSMQKLTAIYIPESVTQIADDAFLYTDNVTIWGYAGSYAERYAKANGIPFKSLLRSVSFTQNTYVLQPNATKTLSLVKNPINASESTFTWTSSNQSIVSVNSNGTVKGLREGTATITVTSLNGLKATCKIVVEKKQNGWVRVNGKDYWYENGIKQGTTGRGKEIYDPGSDAWYWLDAVQGGAKAVNKEVYMDYADKWVRYDANGHMIKGWYKNQNGTYYYNLITGAMTKGETTIDNIPCYFNATTGVGHDGWRTYSGKNYWYEHGERQGTKYDKNGVRGDGTIRGREIFDPGTNAWYWLDAVFDGAKAENKEVWMPYIFQNENPKTGGKWVRYNSTGGMIKGWHTEGNRKYYYDPTTGAMVKGTRVIDGKTYHFDSVTGVLK